MEFRLLGPLEVRADEGTVRIAGPRQRAVLALLLLEAGRVVPTSRILDAIWDEPPQSGPKAVQMCVSALRKALPPGLLVTSAPGYRLEVDPEAVDVHRFERMLAEARTVLDDDPARAAELLREALGLWRGPALAEFPAARFAAAEAARLEALHDEAVEQRIEADLALGRAAELVPELEGLVARHPLRERLRAQLMRALYRSGRQADALAVYQDARTTLVEELGVDPGPALQRLHQAILRQDADLDARPAAAKPLASREQRPPAPVEERKVVTALFADLAESTALGEQLDPERLRVVLGDYFEAMADVVTRWGGTVEKFIGDAVVALFGVPALREDDAERALAAALEMRSRIGELNSSLLERHGVTLALKVGVNTGEVLAGAATGQFMVTGDAINSAARLEQAAEPGEILVGERTERAGRNAFELVDAGEFALKGKAASVRAWRLVGTRRERSHRRGRVASRLVGRERELLLLETFRSACVDEGRPHLVALVGNAGIGKSRLVEEFLSRAPTPVHRGRCLSYGEGITYWSLREVVWSAAGILFDDSGPVATTKLRALVDALPELNDDERERVRFALGVTAGHTAADELGDLSPERVHEELTLAWPLFLTALARHSALVLVIEDVHWAEPPLLDMLDRLLLRAAGPVLIVATSRPDGGELPSLLHRRPRAQQISLEPLSGVQARDLLAQLLPDAPAALETALLETAEGNPLFLEELAQHVADLGADSLESLRIPDTVRALLAARIDGLPPEQKAVLYDAAVVGRTFWTTALDSIRGEDTRSACAMLEDRGLVVAHPTSQLAEHPELSFRHALIREVAYQSIPRARRARAHAATAEWIERLAGDRRDEFIELIAHHAEAAADPDDASLAWPDDPTLRENLRRKAVTALIDAGGAARARFGVEQARAFAGRAAELGAADEERLQVLELRAEIEHAAVRVQEAWSLYLEALTLAERLGDRAAGARLAASATLLWARYFGAFPDTEWHAPAAEVVTTWLGRLGEDTETFEAGALLVGRALFDFDDILPRSAEDSIADAERALAVAESLASPRLLSYAVDALTMLMAVDGLCDAARAARLAAGSRARVADRWTAHEMLINAAELYAAAGELDEAGRVAAEASREAATLSTHQRIHAAAAQTYALVPPGRLADLREATAAVPDLVEEEERTACYHGLVALAGQLLAAHEAGDRQAAARSGELMDAVTSAGPDPLGERLRAIELVLRVQGTDWGRRRLKAHPPPSRRTERIRYCRSALQVAALDLDRAAAGRLASEGRQLGRDACAPGLGCIADWAEALVSGEWRAAEHAALRLDETGERYLSARLLADLVPLISTPDRARVAEDAAVRLGALGAAASAAEVRAVAS